MRLITQKEARRATSAHKTKPQLQTELAALPAELATETRNLNLNLLPAALLAEPVTNNPHFR